MPFKFVDESFTLIECSYEEYYNFSNNECRHLLKHHAPAYGIGGYIQCLIAFEGINADNLFYVVLLFDYDKSKPIFSRSYPSFKEVCQAWEEWRNLINYIYKQECSKGLIGDFEHLIPF